MNSKRLLNMGCVSVFITSIIILTFLTAHAASQSPDPPLFLPAVTYASGGTLPNFVAVADVNADGKPDLLLANIDTGTVSLLLGNGDGTFKAPVNYSSGGTSASALAVADINGDGKLDVVVANYGNNTVGVLLGNGDGTFKQAVTYSSGGYLALSVAIADVNGDGKPDILVVDCGRFTGCGGGGNGAIAVLLGNGDGTFQPAVSYDAGKGPLSLAVADLNRDGRLDIVVADCGANIFCPTSAPGAVSVLLGNGDGTFQQAVSYSSGGISAASVAVADVNGDGKQDLVVTNEGGSHGDFNSDGTVGVLLGNGDGTFQAAVTYDSGGSSPIGVAVGDVDGDGKFDLVIANYGDETVGVLRGNGNGTFQLPSAYGSGAPRPISVAIADLNGDGSPDVAVADIYSGKVGVLLNNTPFCTTAPVITLSANPKSLWPPNGKMVSVTISGTITDTGSGCTIKTAAYAVKDEYGEVQPSGPVTPGAGGNYSFTILLQASRLGADIDGRLYTVTVSATNNGGKTGSQAGTVIVPHDQGH